jgi:hypothetical protein
MRLNIFVPNIEEVTTCWKKQRNGEFHDIFEVCVTVHHDHKVNEYPT